MNYQDRLTTGVQRLQRIHDTRGSVAQVNIGHEEGCGALSGKGCSCTPDITLDVDGSVYMIDEKGDVFRRVLTDS
jgi:hypothetical protein